MPTEWPRCCRPSQIVRVRRRVDSSIGGRRMPLQLRPGSSAGVEQPLEISGVWRRRMSLPDVSPRRGRVCETRISVKYGRLELPGIVESSCNFHATETPILGRRGGRCGRRDSVAHRKRLCHKRDRGRRPVLIPHRGIRSNPAVPRSVWGRANHHPCLPRLHEPGGAGPRALPNHAHRSLPDKRSRCTIACRPVETCRRTDPRLVPPPGAHLSFPSTGSSRSQKCASRNSLAFRNHGRGGVSMFEDTLDEC